MTSTQLQAALERLSEKASAEVVNAVFAKDLIRALGFGQGESHPRYETGNGLVSHALRKTQGSDIFLATRRHPYLLIELRETNVDLSEGSSSYLRTVDQLKVLFRGKNCKSVNWGIITNGRHIQLFRKHGKVIYPATVCIQIYPHNVDKIVAGIQEKIDAPQQALIVALYNNKGGVGKTTTTINLASVLRLAGKRVLVIDFDPVQQDLTSALGIKRSSGNFYQALMDKDFDINHAILSYSILGKGKTIDCFDVIPADEKLGHEITETELEQSVHVGRLRQTLNAISSHYDYILIDSPPSWRFFSKSAIYAANAVLLPTKHNNIFSLENAAVAIKRFIPQVQAERQALSSLDHGPVALPIFWNAGKITPAQREAAHRAIDDIIKQAQQDDNFNLLPYFYPKYNTTSKKRDIFEVRNYAHIANAAFSRLPAAYQDKIARSYYTNLAKEYFLQ